MQSLVKATRFTPPDRRANAEVQFKAWPRQYKVLVRQWIKLPHSDLCGEFVRKARTPKRTTLQQTTKACLNGMANETYREQVRRDIHHSPFTIHSTLHRVNKCRSGFNIHSEMKPPLAAPCRTITSRKLNCAVNTPSYRCRFYHSRINTVSLWRFHCRTMAVRTSLISR